GGGCCDRDGDGGDPAGRYCAPSGELQGQAGTGADGSAGAVPGAGIEYPLR
ncbi:MAG: hypothetical protein QOE71_4242, partial [Pseudonocardiales bacterium]|nr:hypothetical protein [Pseudonocardiales bacterium]